MAQSKIYKRVADPQNPGKLVDAEPVPIIAGKLDAELAVELENGVKVRIQLSLIDISRLKDRKDANGNPVYNINSQGTVKIDFPPGMVQ